MEDLIGRADKTTATQADGGQAVGDKITLGDTTGSAVAVGRGAQAIIQNIQTYVERSLTDLELAEQDLRREDRLLAEAVTAYIQRLQHRAEGGAQLPQTGNPYKALLEYDLQDAALFYGRSSAIQELSQRLMRDQLTVLHSGSGVGKTSLLKAGLMPRLLIEGHIPLYLRPYNTPVPQALKRTLIPNLDLVPGIVNARMYELLRRMTDLLDGKQLVVIIDQLEELFTVQSQADRQSYINELEPCLEDDSLFVRWVFAIRGEWFSQLGTFRPQIRNPYGNEYQLSALTRAEAQEVILEPARRQGVAYERQLVDRLLDDLGEDEISPPQLQLVCSALYEDLDSGNEITGEMYASAGETGGILRGHLKRVLQRDIPAGLRRPARSLLEVLVTADGHRGLRSRDELLYELQHLDVPRADFEQLLDQLVDSRLLRVGEQGEDLGGHTYELAHDYLLEEIELDPEIRSRKAAQELLDREVEVYRRHQTLLPRDKLLIIEAYESDLVVNPAAQALLDASREALLAAERASEAERQRIRRAALFGALSGAVIFPIMIYVINNTPSSGTFLDTFVILSILPGAIAGLLLILLVDMAMSYTRERPAWQAPLGVGTAGAISLGFLVSYLGILNSNSGDYSALFWGILVGGIWGIWAGLGRAWMVERSRPRWLTLPVVAVICGVVFLVAGMAVYQQAFSPLIIFFDPDEPIQLITKGYVFLAGALIPAAILFGASLAD